MDQWGDGLHDGTMTGEMGYKEEAQGIFGGSKIFYRNYSIILTVVMVI